MATTADLVDELFRTRHRLTIGGTYYQGSKVFTKWTCSCGARTETTGYTAAAKRAFRRHASQ